MLSTEGYAALLFGDKKGKEKWEDYYTTAAHELTEVKSSIENLGNRIELYITDKHLLITLSGLYSDVVDLYNPIITDLQSALYTGRFKTPPDFESARKAFKGFIHAGRVAIGDEKDLPPQIKSLLTLPVDPLAAATFIFDIIKYLHTLSKEKKDKFDALLKDSRLSVWHEIKAKPSAGSTL
jgi:hypothetical protein